MYLFVMFVLYNRQIHTCRLLGADSGDRPTDCMPLTPLVVPTSSTITQQSLSTCSTQPVREVRFSAQNAPETVWRPGSLRTRWGGLQR